MLYDMRAEKKMNFPVEELWDFRCVERHGADDVSVNPLGPGDHRLASFSKLPGTATNIDFNLVA